MSITGKHGLMRSRISGRTGVFRYTPKQRSIRAAGRIRKLIESYPANGMTVDAMWAEVQLLVAKELWQQRGCDLKKISSKSEEENQRAAFKRWALEDKRRER